MTRPFNIIPGSDAEHAMQEIAKTDLTHGNLAGGMKQVLDKYGVSPLTSSAATEAAQQLAGNNPQINTSELAQNIVGSAVADPTVAANKAMADVAAQQGLSLEEKQEYAVAAAGREAIKAGADGPAAQQQARQAMDQGMTPEQAAYAGTAAAVAAAVANNPSPSGFEIYGYLKAMVQDLVMETYLGTEKKDVTNVTTWNIGSTWLQTTSTSLTINCSNYTAEAKDDTSILDKSKNFYWGGYTMTSPNPVSKSWFSLSMSGVTTSTYGYKIASIAALKTVAPMRDLYVALLSTDKFTKKDLRAGKIVCKTMLHICRRAKTIFS